MRTRVEKRDIPLSGGRVLLRHRRRRNFLWSSLRPPCVLAWRKETSRSAGVESFYVTAEGGISSGLLLGLHAYSRGEKRHPAQRGSSPSTSPPKAEFPLVFS